MPIKVFPSADIHVSLNNAPAVTLRVVQYLNGPGNIGFTLTDVTNQCAFDLFSPYHNVGQRLQNHHVSINNTGAINAISRGITFVQVRFNTDYMIVRIQVHDDILNWWFGNASLTVPTDATVFHTQPSLYALFSDDAEKTDLVGDITGHGYVTLAPANASLAVDAATGRLRGNTAGNTTVNGSFRGINGSIPVKVVDYGQRRNSLIRVRYAGRASKYHNILFLPEGFRNNQEDRDKFDRIVTETCDKIFGSSSHSPYDLLANSFNVWKIYEPSAQHTITAGFQVNDENAVHDGSTILPSGYFIPYEERASSDSSDNTKYTAYELISKAGLPIRDESRSASVLKALWSTQSLDNYSSANVSDALVAIWKKQRCLGILEARDTFLGMTLGQRWGDRESGVSSPVVTAPANDDGTQPLIDFVKRIYEWFTKSVVRRITPDQRKHPPELFLNGNESLGNTILRYIASLHDSEGTNEAVGAEWIPDPNSAAFRKSRGLIAIIVNDGIYGGTNMNAGTMTAQCINTSTSLSFEYIGGVQRVMKRTPPNNIEVNTGDIILTIAHEFGHSFNLGDEYEEFRGDAPPGQGDIYDNISHIVSINQTLIVGPATLPPDRLIDPNKVKWFKLPRIKLSDILEINSVNALNVITMYVASGNLNLWTEAKNNNLKATIRRRQVTVGGTQLPLSTAPNDVIRDLDILEVSASTVSSTSYTFIKLGGSNLPSTLPPDFEEGSLVYLPLRDDANQIIDVVEKKVFDFINGALPSNHSPLNSDPDRVNVRKEADSPIGIPDFKPPCKSYKLIAAYEGGATYPGLTYRPAGDCKMRNKGSGDFCFVCKYLIVNRVNGGLLASLDGQYPTRKKG